MDYIHKIFSLYYIIYLHFLTIIYLIALKKLYPYSYDNIPQILVSENLDSFLFLQLKE